MKRNIGLVAFGCLALVAVACGGSTPAPTAPIATPAPAATPVAEPAAAPAPAAGGTMVANFDSQDRVSALGGEFGSWASAAPDPAATCLEELVGGSWKISYDISKEGSYCGTWMKMKGFDATPFKNLVIRVKGEGQFSPTFIVELKTGEGAALKVARRVVSGVTSEWQNISIPLAEFKDLPSLQGLSELTTVYDMQTCPVRKGTYLIDSINFE